MVMIVRHLNQGNLQDFPLAPRKGRALSCLFEQRN